MAKVAELQEKLAWQAKQMDEMAKNLASTNNTLQFYSKKAERVEAELEEMHEFLNGVPMALPRKDEPSCENSYPKERRLLVRLAAWLGALKVA